MKVGEFVLKRTLKCIVLTLCIALFVACPVSADTGSFARIETENDTAVTAISRNVFEPVETITGASLNTEMQLSGLSDIFVSNNGDIYLLCSEISRIIKMNSDYTLNKEITVTDNEGNEVSFSGAQGLYIEKNGNIYLADTNNSQIIIIDSNGKILDRWAQPESDIIPKDFIYNPIKILKNSDGYTYVLSRGCYYGTIVYDPDGKFTGFMGANSVNATVIDAFTNLIKGIFTSEEKQSAQVKNLPYSFVDFSMDKQGYIITCTGSTEATTNGVGQIRRINSSGSNILFKTYSNGESVSSTEYNFLEKEIIKKQGMKQIQNIVSVDVDKNGFMYALDKTFGLIYVYDSDCNFLTAFGGLDDTMGRFTDPVALAVTDKGLLVADLKKSTVTVFEITDFGKKLFSAQLMYLDGEYTASEPLWNEVLKLDRYNQPAYRGLSMISYNKGDYSGALKLAKAGYDYSVYDMAYQKLFTSFIADNFVWLFIIIVAFLGGITALFVYLKKNKKVLVKNQKLRTACSVTFHPYVTFDEIKYNNRGSIILALILAFAFFVSASLKATGSGFLFTDQAAKDYNALYTLAKTIGLLVLWSVSNWLVCALLSGRGKLKEIFMATVYALIPYIIWTFISIGLSWILPLSGVGLISGLNTVILIYTFFLLSVAMMKIHDFNFFRFLLTSVVTLLAMLFIVFIIFMMVILLQQFWNMIYAVFTETLYR